MKKNKGGRWEKRKKMEKIVKGVKEKFGRKMEKRTKWWRIIRK